MGYFGQVLTAMVTPFNEQLELDLKATEQLITHLIETGSDAIVVAGTTGEGPTLTKEEKLKLFQFSAAVAKGRVKVIANVGSNNTAESIQFAKEVEKLNGIDGLMVVNPYYNKPPQEGLYAHFEQIALNTTLPILLYNIPGRTGVNLHHETTIRLANIPNIVAIKESSGDLSQIAKVIEYTDSSFSVYSGDDDLTLPIVALGGAGVVSVASHLYGEEIKAMIQNQDAALHRQLLPFFEALFVTTNPVPVKHALKYTGIGNGYVRLPLMEMNNEAKLQLEQAYLLMEKKLSPKRGMHLELKRS